MHVTVVSLDEVDTLPDETYGDLLHGFTKCSNEEFEAVLLHLLTQERINHFSLCSLLAACNLIVWFFFFSTLHNQVHPP